MFLIYDENSHFIFAPEYHRYFSSYSEAVDFIDDNEMTHETTLICPVVFPPEERP